MKAILSITATLIAIIFVTFLSGCDTEEPIGIGVNAVYYGERTVDVYYFGGAEHTNDKVYLIGVDLDTTQSKFYVDWEDLCRAEDNNIIWAGESGPMGFPYQDFLLRLESFYDPTADSGKKIYFNDKMFEVGWTEGGVFGRSGTYNAYISSDSKTIDFSYR